MIRTTDRVLPGNAPFYEKNGFVELLESDWTPAIRAIAAEEGVTLGGRRLVMWFTLTSQ